MVLVVAFLFSFGCVVSFVLGVFARDLADRIEDLTSVEDFAGWRDVLRGDS